MNARSFVVDASVALKWVLNEPDRDRAYALLDHALLAPDLMLLECANALRSRVARGGVAVDDVHPSLVTIREAPVGLTPTVDLLEDALTLGLALQHPVYDCVYLALGLRTGSQVVTADRRFREVVGGEPRLHDEVVLLSDLAH